MRTRAGLPPAAPAGASALRRRKTRLHRRLALRRGLLERRAEAAVAAREHQVVDGQLASFLVRHQLEAILQQVRSSATGSAPAEHRPASWRLIV